MLISPGSLPANGIFDIRKIIPPRMAILMPINIIIFPRFEKLEFIFFYQYYVVCGPIYFALLNASMG